MANRKFAEIRVELPLAAARELAEAGLREIGARYIKPVDNQVQGVIRASIASMGEKVTATVDPLSAAAARITIVSVSAIPTTLLDWGKNQKNVDRFVAAVLQLEQLHRQAEKPGGSEPD